MWGMTPNQQDPLSQMGLPSELALNDIIAQLAARVASAQGAAAQASTAYGSAAAAPEPNIYRDSPGRVAAGTGLARLAEGLGATDQPVERARQTISTQQKSMSARRLENLRALHQNYEALAERADKLGDLEASVKYKQSSDKVAREQQKIIDADKAESAMGQVRERNKGTLEATKERNKGTLAAAGIRARATTTAAATRKGAGAGAATSLTNLDSKVEAVVNGEAKLFHFPQAERGEIVAKIHATGRRIIPDKARTAINELASAETVIDEIDTLSKQLNTAKAGIDRFKQGGENRWKALLQSGPAAELTSVRGGLAGNLARAISAERGVLTDQDRKFAMGLVPTFDDTAAHAASKISRLRRFLASKRESAISNYSSDLARGVKSGSSAGSSRTISKFGDPSSEPGPDDAHSQVMELLRAGDRDAVIKLIQANPDLDEDPEINAVIDELFPAEQE